MGIDRAMNEVKAILGAMKIFVIVRKTCMAYSRHVVMKILWIKLVTRRPKLVMNMAKIPSKTPATIEIMALRIADLSSRFDSSK